MLRLELTATTECEPDIVGDVSITARSVNQTAKSDTACAVVIRKAVQSVTLTTTPSSPVLTNTPVTLTAQRHRECGGIPLPHLGRHHLERTARWGTSNTCTWTPTRRRQLYLAGARSRAGKHFVI